MIINKKELVPGPYSRKSAEAFLVCAIDVCIPAASGKVSQS